ncbi:hypothetical protein BDZ89DRAFT_1045516 [Hymenopellis radicata]|nr:hypothetical protein BDZ89DRAFT_1045516 [Hymenopellis radicata]
MSFQSFYLLGFSASLNQSSLLATTRTKNDGAARMRDARVVRDSKSKILTHYEHAPRSISFVETRREPTRRTYQEPVQKNHAPSERSNAFAKPEQHESSQRLPSILGYCVPYDPLTHNFLPSARGTQTTESASSSRSILLPSRVRIAIELMLAIILPPFMYTFDAMFISQIYA